MPKQEEEEKRKKMANKKNIYMKEVQHATHKFQIKWEKMPSHHSRKWLERRSKKKRKKQQQQREEKKKYQKNYYHLFINIQFVPTSWMTFSRLRRATATVSALTEREREKDIFFIPNEINKRAIASQKSIFLIHLFRPCPGLEPTNSFIMFNYYYTRLI